MGIKVINRLSYPLYSARTLNTQLSITFLFCYNRSMKIVVGLGNPGSSYKDTRHNVGFMVIDCLARDRGIAVNQRGFHSRRGEGRIGAEQVLLIEPQTYMNLSGNAVREVVKFYRVPLTDLLVICDDLNLPTGRLRLRPKGSAGGHNGLTSIIRNLGTEEFARLRIGIDMPPFDMAAETYVLKRFSREERPLIDDTVARAAECTLTWIYHGIDEAMNRYNG